MISSSAVPRCSWMSGHSQMFPPIHLVLTLLTSLSTSLSSQDGATPCILGCASCQTSFQDLNTLDIRRKHFLRTEHEKKLRSIWMEHGDWTFLSPFSLTLLWITKILLFWFSSLTQGWLVITHQSLWICKSY